MAHLFARLGVDDTGACGNDDEDDSMGLHRPPPGLYASSSSDDWTVVPSRSKKKATASTISSRSSSGGSSSTPTLRASNSQRRFHEQDAYLVLGVLAWLPSDGEEPESPMYEALVSNRLDSRHHASLVHQVLCFDLSHTPEYMQNKQPQRDLELGSIIGLFISKTSHDVVGIKHIRPGFKSERCHGHTTNKYGANLCDFAHPDDLVGCRDWLPTTADHVAVILHRLQRLPGDSGSGKRLYAPSSQYTHLHFPGRQSHRQSNYGSFRDKLRRHRQSHSSDFGIGHGVIVRVRNANQFNLGLLVETSSLAQYVFDETQIERDGQLEQLQPYDEVEFTSLPSFSYNQEIYMFAVISPAVVDSNAVDMARVPRPSRPEPVHTHFEELQCTDSDDPADRGLALVNQLKVAVSSKQVLEALDLLRELGEELKEELQDPDYALSSDATVEQVCEFVRQAASRRHFRNEDATACAVELIRQHNVTGDDVRSRLSEIDKDVLCDLGFSNRLRQIVLAALRSSGDADAAVERRITETDKHTVCRAGSIKFFVHDKSTKKSMEIGYGATAKVFPGEWENTEGRITHVAVKAITVVDGYGLDHQPFADNELRALRTVHHDNVVRMFDYQQARESWQGKSKFLYLALEPCKRNLREAIRDGLWEFPNLLRRVDLCAGICKGLQALHGCKAENATHGILHRDIKPENVLLKLNQDGSWIPKLCDMGFSRFAKEKGKTSLYSKTTHSRILRHGLGSDRYGCPYLLSFPENKQREAFVMQSDIFAAGCVLYEILTTRHLPDVAVGFHPFEDPQKRDDDDSDDDEEELNRDLSRYINKRIKKRKPHFVDIDRIKDPAHTGAEMMLAEAMKDLVCRMIELDYEERPPINVVLSVFEDHPARLTGRARYFLIDELLKGVGKVLVPLIEALGHHVLQELKQHIQGELQRTDACNATMLHDEWLTLTNVNEVKVKGSGRVVFPMMKTAEQVNKQVHSRRLSDAKALGTIDLAAYGKAAQAKNFLARDDILHEADGLGQSCLCVTAAKWLNEQHGAGPNWANSDVLKWYDDPWELLKLFTASLGHRAKKCPTPLLADLSSLASIPIWCKLTEPWVCSTAGLTAQHYEQLVEGLREVQVIRNDHIAHAVEQDCETEQLKIDAEHIVQLLQNPVLRHHAKKECDELLKKIAEKACVSQTTCP